MPQYTLSHAQAGRRAVAVALAADRAAVRSTGRVIVRIITECGAALITGEPIVVEHVVSPAHAARCPSMA